MKLAVIMPVNRIDSYLLDSLESLKNQTFKEFDLIIVCSSDIVERLSAIMLKVCDKLTYKIVSTRLNGLAFALNLGISEVEATYIARWDSDDLCEPNRFKRQIEELDKNDNLAIIGTRVKIIGPNGDEDRFRFIKFYSDNKAIRRALKYRHPLVHPSLMFRASVIFQNSGYLYGHTSEDHELFIRIARDPEVEFMNITDVVTYYRKHPAQLSDIKNIKKNFCEISGFMFTEFLYTGNPLYILGMLVNLPLFRRGRHTYRKILSSIY